MSLGQHSILSRATRFRNISVPTLVGTFMTLVSLLVLAGWVFGLTMLTSVLPGLAVMKPNTASCFLLIGMALVFRDRSGVRLACAGVVFAVAWLTLSEYATGWDFGIDRAVFLGISDAGMVYPGRMSGAAAFGFLMGSATLMLNRGPFLLAQQTLAVGVGVIGMIGLMGYLFDVQALYQFAYYSCMALHTAATFVVLSVGLVFLRSDGLAWMLTDSGAGSHMARRLLPATIAIPLLAGWLLEMGFKYSLCGPTVGTVLIVMVMILALQMAIWWVAGALNRMETARHESERQFRLLFEDNPNPMWVFDEKTYRFLAVNIAAQRQYGYSLDEFLTMDVLDVHPPEDRKQIAAVIETHEKTSGIRAGIFRHCRKDGARMDVEVVASTVLFDARPCRLALVRDVTERKQAEEWLKASLAEKEVLLKEVHHRVKNNLQVISSLVSLQTSSESNPAVRVLLEDVRDRVRTMALVHEKLYESANLGAIDFAEYARSLLNYLWRAHGQLAAPVRLTLDMAPVTLSVQAAVPCGLILNELACNALKHAFSGRATGEVMVVLRHDDAGLVRLRVSDNGVGLRHDLDWRQSTSLGLRLVRLLTEQLGGTVESRLPAGGGTEFEIVFSYHETHPLPHD